MSKDFQYYLFESETIPTMTKQKLRCQNAGERKPFSVVARKRNKQTIWTPSHIKNKCDNSKNILNCSMKGNTSEERQTPNRIQSPYIKN